MLGFLRKAQAVIWTSVLIILSIGMVKTDHIITIMEKKREKKRLISL
jgi:hypothetical protein